jgi:hypothetical protein
VEIFGFSENFHRCIGEVEIIGFSEIFHKCIEQKVTHESVGILRELVQK